MASSYNVTALTDYVDVNKDELFVKSIAGAKTMDYVDLMGNVKYKEALIFLDSTATLQADSCGFNPQGGDVYSEKFIEVKPFKVEKEWCWLDVDKKYANYLLRHEAGRETVAFEEKMLDATVSAIENSVESIIWGGNSTLGIDGLKAQILASSDATEVQKGATATETIDALVEGVSAEMLAKGVDIFVSYSFFRQYVGELNRYCCANRPIIDASAESIEYVGDSRIRIIPVLGLEGAAFAVATTKENFVVGTDIIGAEGVYKVWRDEADDMLRMRVRSTLGTQLKFEDEIVFANL